MTKGKILSSQVREDIELPGEPGEADFDGFDHPYILLHRERKCNDSNEYD